MCVCVCPYVRAQGSARTARDCHEEVGVQRWPTVSGSEGVDGSRVGPGLQPRSSFPACSLQGAKAAELH